MRILVVEDEPDIRAATASTLREDGYAVDEAEDGEEGLYKATTWDYDAIVLDVMLPGIDGFELLRRLRKTHRMPVLLLTARDGLEDRVTGLDLGADDYLIKPFALAELLARLRALIRRSAGQAKPVIGELLAMRRDMVLPLTSRVDDPVQIMVGERVIARGELEEIGDEPGRLGVRLTEVINVNDMF